MSLKSYFPEQFDQLKAFFISGTEVVRHLKIDAEMKPMLMKALARMEEDREFPHALTLCADRDGPVHWLTTSGHHTASLTATAGQVQRRLRPNRAVADEATCLRLAKALARAKVEGPRPRTGGHSGPSRSRPLSWGNSFRAFSRRICRPIRRIAARGSGPSSSIRLCSDTPLAKGMTRYGKPCDSSTRWIAMTFSCSTAAAA